MIIILILFLAAGWSSGEEHKAVRAWTEIAIAKSQPLKIFSKKIELAEARVWQARRSLFPELSFAYKDWDGKISGLAYDGLSYKGKLTQKIFDGGRSNYTLSIEELALEKARKEYEKFKKEIVYKTMQNYWKLVQTRLSRENLEATVKEIEDLLTLAERIDKEGLISGQEYLEIKSQGLKSMVKKNNLEKEEALALLDFQQAVNLKEEEAVEIEREISLKPVEVQFPALWETAKQNRLEGRISYLDKKMGRFNFLIARRENWPEASLTFSYGSSAEDYKSNRLDLDDEWQVLGKITLNIGSSSVNYAYDKEELAPVVSSVRGQEIESHEVSFSLLDRLDKYNKIREKEIKFKEAAEALEEIERKLRREVEEAYLNLKKARINIEAARAELLLREKEEEIISLKKNLGKANLAELVVAKTNLADSKNFYLTSQVEYLLAIAALNQAIGQPFYFSP